MLPQFQDSSVYDLSSLSSGNSDNADYNEINILQSNLNDLLKEREKLENELLTLKLERVSFKEQVKKLNKKHKNEKVNLIKVIEQLEKKLQDKKAKEEKIIEAGDYFYYQDKTTILMAEIETLKEDLKKERTERQNVERRFLEEMMYIQSQFKNILVEWVKKTEKSDKKSQKTEKNKEQDSEKVVKNETSQERRSNSQKNVKPTTEINQISRSKELQLKPVQDMRILDEIFFKKNPFSFNFDSSI